MSAGATPAARHRPSFILLRSETTQFAVVDVGQQGPALGLGDELISSDQLFRSGKPTGRSGSVLTVVGVGQDTLTMQWLTTLELGAGQLVLQGIGDGPKTPPTTPVSVTLAVTGGTGAYAQAEGTATVVDEPGGIETITVRLGR